MAIFVLKAAIAGLLIAFSSKLAGRNPLLAGFIIALPLSSVLSILFSYYEFRDMEKVNQFAVSILAAVPLSLVFFLPFVLNRWLKMGFTLTFIFALGLLAAVYFVHQWIVHIWFR